MSVAPVSPAPAAESSTYRETCDGVTAYIEGLEASGLADPNTTRESMGTEFVELAEGGPEWAGMSPDQRADFKRGVDAAVAGNC